MTLIDKMQQKSLKSPKIVLAEKINMRLRRDADGESKANDETELHDHDEYEMENEDSDRPVRMERDASSHANDLQNDVKELGYDIK